MLFRILRERRERRHKLKCFKEAREQYVVDALEFLVEGMKHVMTIVDDLKASADRLETGVQSAIQRIESDAAAQKELVAKLAEYAASPRGVPESELAPLVSRFNTLADGLSNHLAPVAEAASAVTASAGSAEPGPGSTDPAPQA